MKKAAFLFFRVEVGNAACAVQYLVVVQTMLVRCPKNLDFTVFQKVSLSNLIFLATGESTLIEGNNWGDYFWGKVNNCGENQLGIILMDVRAKLQWNAETAPNNIPQCLQ